MAVNLAQELQYFDGIQNGGILRKILESMIDALNAPDTYFSISVDGAAADTNMAISGILTTDTIVAATEVTITTAALVDRTGTTSITSAGNIQCSVDTTSDHLLVVYRRDATVQITKT